MPFSRDGGEIFRAIEAMDRQGMGLVEAQDPAGFAAYLKATDNTICGRHPIGAALMLGSKNQSVAHEARTTPLVPPPLL